MNTVTVVKVSGRELDDPAFLKALCAVLARLHQRTILVHGGGKEISAAMDRYGQTVQFVEGIRVTPPESMAIMEMVVCGSINKRLVAHLVAHGKTALGLSGVDLGLLRCVPYRPGGADLGYVGEVTTVEVALLHTLLDRGWLPVLAPVALGQDDYQPYNINADHYALAVAAALAHADEHPQPVELVFVSTLAGVLLNGHVVPRLTALEIEHHIQAGAITNGMIPKVRSALAALAAGVTSVRITNLEGLADGGTRIIESDR
jgi:acetylglutamate kinase